MRIFNRIAVYALLLVLPMAGFAQATSSSQSTAVGGGMSERMSQVVGAKAMFPNGQQAGTVRDIVVGDKGDFSYLVIEFNRDALGAGTSVQGGTTTGTTQTPAGTTGTNTTQSGTTAQTQTPSGASNSGNANGQTTTTENQTGTSGTAAAASTNRYLVPVTDVTFDVANKTVSLTINPSDVLSLQTLEGDQIPATLGVGTAGGSMSSGATNEQSSNNAQTGNTTGTTKTPAGTTGTNTSQSGTTAQTQTPSGASNSATQNQSSTNNNNNSSSSGTSSGAMMAQSNAAYSSTQWFLGSKLKDYTLVDPQGKDLGKISDAMLDLSSHQIAYLAFGVGGFLGIGEKIVALPLTDITSWDTANHKVMVTMTSDSLKNAQGIDKKNWPSSASEAGAASNGAASGSSSGQTK